ncbi:DUF2313 domain-containing protein [Archangium violaceum]|uniref:putative phage tail protein n=1 Tax=Archangium violaceum TaxID=83451 RepID=UPI002B27C59F|nr:DUF2313 domain-containing protein [Archangium violaceum]
MLLQLLPRGRLWLTELGTDLWKLMLGMAEEFRRVELRGEALVKESDPRTATETLPEWERQLGLPDERIQAIPDTVEKRRLAVTQKYLSAVQPAGSSSSSSSAKRFIELAKACGYTVSVFDKYNATIARVDRLRCEQPLRALEWTYAWTVTVQPPTGPALSHDELERVIRALAPSHTTVNFIYL